MTPTRHGQAVSASRTGTGVLLVASAVDGRRDEDVVQEHLDDAVLAEALGFDAAWVLEHHYTGYALSSSPFQWLAWIAARTEAIGLGTAVIVLPWHDPVRLAGEIATIDALSRGRARIGVGRGRPQAEHALFTRPEMRPAPDTFEGAARRLINVACEGVDAQGRPRPALRAGLKDRLYVAGGPDTAALMFDLGYRQFIAPAKSGPSVSATLDARRDGSAKPGLTIAATVFVRESAEDAATLARTWATRDAELAAAHYKTAPASDATADCIVGTPEACAAQLKDHLRASHADSLICEFGVGGMPRTERQESMRIFATRVMPLLDHA